VTKGGVSTYDSRAGNTVVKEGRERIYRWRGGDLLDLGKGIIPHMSHIHLVLVGTVGEVLVEQSLNLVVPIHTHHYIQPNKRVDLL
jgi:hypothetical protein